MPTFQYKARGIDGKKVSGQYDCAEEGMLHEFLKEQGLYALRVKNTDARSSILHSRMKTMHLANFCRELGTLLNAGVTLVRALKIIANEEGLKPAYKEVFLDVLTIVRQGTSLSDAMEKQGKTFPPLLINMIRAAEANGNIGDTSIRMANHYEKEHRLNGKIVGAMIYPAILCGLLLIVIVFVLVFLVPQFSEVFSMSETLPLPTKILLGLSEGLKNNWPTILGMIVFLGLIISVLLQVDKVRIAKDRIKLKIPVLGKLWKVVYTARFARTLSSLYGSGIPIAIAIQTAANTIGNAYIQSQFPEMLAKIRAGQSLSKALKEVDGFQQKLASSIEVGEETGSLETMLNSMAESLDYEAEKALQRMVTLMEPLLIIIMAIIIGFVVVAVILPIYESYSMIEQSGY